MIIKSKSKEYELTFKARQMIRIGEEIGGQYELEVGAYKNDIGVLAKLISICCDALTYENALDLIDELLEDNKSVRDIYIMIFEEMNKKAFFMNKLQASDTPPINLEVYMQKMMEQMGDKLMTADNIETLANMSKALEK